MAVKSDVKCGVARRKSSQSVTFCIKEERNASYKKVSHYVLHKLNPGVVNLSNVNVPYCNFQRHHLWARLPDTGM
jgi:hypothetical protein